METKGIHLSEIQVSAICTAFKACFRADDHLWLFGSRVDPTKRGGDMIFMLKQF